MTFEQRLMIIAATAVAMALPTLRRNTSELPDARSPPGGLTAVSLIVVAGALLAVGVVSQTLLRHAIQIAPLVIALGLLSIRSAWAASAAAPLFAFWFLIMGAIWLFLLGVARIVTGTFATAEIVLTVVIGAASLLGLGTTYRRGARGPSQLGTIVIFAALQFAALWLSTQSFAVGHR